MFISVIIPSFNSQNKLVRLLDSLSNLRDDSYEIIVVDDCSTDNTEMAVENYNVNYIRLDKNSGPAVCRNIGAGAAKGEIFAFTDSDCRVGRNWLRNIGARFADSSIDAIIGRLVIDRSNYLGNSISALGFPAGGSIGFEKIWKVDKDGFTNSMSSCNCAVRKEVFEEVDGFNETFPYAGGEDSFLAYSLRQKDYRIKYCPDVIIYHEARSSFSEFYKWQFKRGISSYMFSTKVNEKSDFISLRLWSTVNVMKYNFMSREIPLILFLFISGYLIQTAGFVYGRYIDK